MWHDAFEWAERLRRGEQVEVADVEQQVLDRASYILYRDERLQGIWSICAPRSLGNQILVALSGLAPVAGALAFAGNVQFRHVQSTEFSTGAATQIVLLSFLIGLGCQIVGIVGWWRAGLRTRESDLLLSGLLLGGSGFTLVFAAIRDGVDVGGVYMWPTWASFFAALASLCSFVFGNSTKALPKVEISDLSEVETQLLLDHRNAALKEAAKRKAVKLRTVNKAIKKPLGALVVTRKGTE
ncbi:hypothetical protein ACFVDI_17370 [Nocardioides sp. NPDC057767]|uniref:hypothetical protein n=1 Tax=unclassified Nocardioides TaxID=2615069 RepID=UPI003672B32E